MTVRRRYQLAYAFIAAVSAVFFFLLASQVSFETLYLYSRQHEDWQLDEALWLFIVGTFALLAMLALHSRRLAQEVSLRKAAEAAARDVSLFDEVTGLPNRRMFLEALDEKVAQARRDGARVALLVIDFDNFRTINDRLGHAGGDRILRIVADRMKEQIHPQDTLARLGSDEFAILFPLMADAPVEDVFRLAERLLDAAREPFHIRTEPIDLTGSIGVAKFPRDAASGDDLLLHAERALLQAKREGKNRYTLFDPSLDSKRRERAELEAELKAGMAAGQIVAFYQPLVRLSDHAPVGVEALARWRHPARGLVGPGEFMDVAQDIGLMGCLLDQMLRRVCEDTGGWPEALTVAVNVSPRQIVDEALAPAIFSILDEAGFPARRLEIEITETALLLDFAAARRTMLALKARGVQLALDDFGTGYSSFTHLHQLPFDKMKIDRSFIHGFIGDAQRRKIVSSMIQLGKSLELVTVAEGVECLEEVEWLRRMGCDLVQGYVFARPMPADEAEREWVAGAGGVNTIRMARVN